MFERMDEPATAEEMFLRHQIGCEFREYQRRIQPYVDRLAEISARKLPQRLLPPRFYDLAPADKERVRSVYPENFCKFGPAVS